MKPRKIVLICFIGIIVLGITTSKADLNKAPTDLKPISPLSSTQIQKELKNIDRPSIQTLSAEPLVKVKIDEVDHSFSLRGENLIILGLSKKNNEILKTNSRVHLIISYLKKNGEGYWLVSNASQKQTTIITEKNMRIKGDHLQINSHKAPEKIIIAVKKKKVEIVGVLPLEEYLVGVLLSEVPKTWPMEALKAQSVAARSYALAVMRERKKENYHLESSVLDQVYKFHGKTEQNLAYANVESAVRSTKGQFLATGLGLPVKTFFHADCGGSTTTSKNAWTDIRDSKNEVVVLDKSCALSHRNSWGFSLSLEELEALTGLQGISRIEADMSKDDQRVRSVHMLNGLGQRLKSFSGNEFRSLLGFNKLKSTRFTFSVEGKTLNFIGRGFGHGVGLCQWGSKAMADRGRKYSEILAHYYPNSIL